MSLSQRRTLLLGRLDHRRTRQREGLVLVEGVRAVAEALGAGVEPVFACVSPRLDAVASGPDVREALERVGCDVEALDDGALSDLADTEHPQGVLLVCREPAGDLVPAPGGHYLMLDAVQDPGNVGTLVRAAVAFGLDGVLVLDGTADPWSPKAVRASAGMAFRMPVRCVDAPTATDLLTSAGVTLLVAAADGTDVRRLATGVGWALAVGNEGAGVRPELRRTAHRSVAVPMTGPAESLNAGVAGAILLYALTEPSGRSTREDEGA